MIQRRGRLGFPLKTAECLRAFGRAVGQELERNKAAEPYIFGLEHHPHCARTEFLNDVIMRDGLANHWRESYFREKGESMPRTVLEELGDAPPHLRKFVEPAWL
jgi:hypothetical protein